MAFRRQRLFEIMDIVRFKGGLGNQMFQYALVESLRHRGREVGCNLGFYRKHPNLMPFVLDKVFENVFLNEVCDEEYNEIELEWEKIKKSGKVEFFKRDLRNRFFYVEEEACKFDRNIFKTNNCTFVGYWQTYKYFEDIRENLLNRYKFHVDNELEKLGNMLSKEYVSIHVRRKDYLSFDRYQTCSDTYYKNAIKKIKEIFPGAKFIFFSDDIEWVREAFQISDRILCSPNDFNVYRDWYDMYLMTRCVGNIIANSSFSWWGAYLNQNDNHIVIAPKKWFNGADTPDIWCDNWIRI